MATTAGTGFIKAGAGTWNIGAQSNAYPGGFTLSAGTVIAGGTNAFGGGSGAFNINGGVIATSGNRNITARYSAINIGGDFTFSNTSNTANFTFADNVSLGTSVRSINIDGTAGTTTHTFSGVVSGAGGGINLGATIGNGILVLSGTNTYSGNTTITRGRLSLTGTGSIASSPEITVGSGAEFNIAGRTGALTLAAGQSLRSSATGSNATATVTVAATPTLTLSAGGLAFTAYGGGGTAPMTVAGAGGTLNVTGPVSVTTTTSLAALILSSSPLLPLFMK